MLDEVFMYVAISMYACTVVEYMTKQTKHLAIYVCRDLKCSYSYLVTACMRFVITCTCKVAKYPHIYIHACTHPPMHTHKYINVCMHRRMHTQAHTHTHTHAYTANYVYCVNATMVVLLSSYFSLSCIPIHMHCFPFHMQVIHYATVYNYVAMLLIHI